MKNNRKNPIVFFAGCVLILFGCIGLASLIQSDFGRVEISTGYFSPDISLAAGEAPVRIAYKLYKPKSATAANPVPAVLAMHGYQNDKETSAAFAIELARRGIAVLAADLYGHGDTKPGMRGRGWGKYKITNLNKELNGPDRYMVMMTFSILDFFREKISFGVADSSMGGKSAWQFLGSLPFVDASKMGVTGHSMGTWASWSVAAAFPDHRAVVLQCGEIFPLDYYDSQRIKFNNVLLLQALYDEFDNFRDYERVVPGLEKTPPRYRDFMGQNSPVEWNKTYGSFADGSARRMELLKTSHRLVTYDDKALTASINWFANALEVTPNIQAKNHVFGLKEFLSLLAMLAALVSMLPLFEILTTHVKYFTPLAQPLAQKPKMLSPKSRKTTILTAVLISGITFPFLGQLGHGLIPFPKNIFRMTIGNGFITWLTFLMLVALCTMLYWFKRGEGKKTGWTLSDLGLALRPSLVLRSCCMAFLLTAAMYALVCISVWIFKLDFRFIWPFFRPFSLTRLGQFFVYLPFYAAFFTVNAGVKLYGQLRLPEYLWKGKKSPAYTQFVWWGYSILVMLGGLFIIVLIEYIPFFLGIGPGADLLFTPLFGGPFMSVLILLIPQFAIFFFISTWLFRKSGTIYTGSFVLGILAAWVLSSGSAMF